MPAGLGPLSPVNLGDVGTVRRRPRVPVGHQPQPVGPRCAAAHLRGGLRGGEHAARSARLLRLLPGPHSRAVGPGPDGVDTESPA